MNSFLRTTRSRAAGAFFAVLLLTGIAAGQGSEDNGDIRQTVARISFLTGNVSYARGDDPDNWQAADFNVPLTIGDRLYTGDDGRAELQVHGGFYVHLGAQADLAALNLADDTKQWSLNAGYASFRIRRLGDNEIFEVDTPNAAITFERVGEYRVDVDADGNTRVTVRRGRALVAAGGGQVPLNAGDQMNVDGADNPRYDVAAAGATDGFDRWVEERQRRSEASRSRKYVNDSIVGVADLDEHGRWESIPSHGMAWTPTVAETDWQPYRAGHWIWQDPWGWTWVAAEPWGWAPYHYGRWVNSSSRWWWVPEARSARIVYAPALVAFSGGGPGWSNGGGGFVGWFPLAPRDPFIHWWGSRRGGNVAAVTYVNRGFITVVNHNTFVSGGLVTSNWVRDRAVVSSIQRAPILRGPLPIVPTSASLRVAMRPGVSQGVRPPQAVLARAVVVRVQPPPPPPSFQTKVEVIRENRGAPIDAAVAARMTVKDRGVGRPAYAVRSVAAESGKMTFTPKTESPRSPRPEPVAPLRGRPLAAAGSSSPAPAGAPPPTPSGPPDRGRRRDDANRGGPGPTPAAGAPAATPVPLDRRRPDDRRRLDAPPTPVPAPAPTASVDRGRRPVLVDRGETKPKSTPLPEKQPQNEPPRRERDPAGRPDNGRAQDTGRPTPGPKPTPASPRDERRRDVATSPRNEAAPTPQPAREEKPAREERQRPTVRPATEESHPNAGPPQRPKPTATPKPK